MKSLLNVICLRVEKRGAFCCSKGDSGVSCGEARSPERCLAFGDDEATFDPALHFRFEYHCTSIAEVADTKTVFRDISRVVFFFELINTAANVDKGFKLLI